MALRICKAGILDTVQDAGRYGYQQWGINPGGVMDTIAMRVANMLVGNDGSQPVIEMHFPAAEIVFETNALIGIAGADFGATVNDMPVAANQSFIATKGTMLRFTQNRSGCRVYLAVHGGFICNEWLGSYGTNLKVQTGGYDGRALQKQDTVLLKQPGLFNQVNAVEIFHWQANVSSLYTATPLQFMAGAEYEYLCGASKQQLQSASFIIGRKSDRMGYRLQGAALNCTLSKEMISSAVTRGTMQLLPDGQLIILMADHQTTGGYPRVGHLVSADIPTLAQLQPGREISFIETGIEAAETKLAKQERNLQQVQNACTFRLQEYFK